MNVVELERGVVRPVDLTVAVDELHEQSLVERAVIRSWIADRRRVVAVWEPAPCPQEWTP